MFCAFSCPDFFFNPLSSFEFSKLHANVLPAMTERIPLETLSFYLIFCFSKLHAIACLNGLQCTSVCVCAYMFV